MDEEEKPTRCAGCGDEVIHPAIGADAGYGFELWCDYCGEDFVSGKKWYE